MGAPSKMVHFKWWDAIIKQNGVASKDGMNKGRIVLIITSSSYVNLERAYWAMEIGVGQSSSDTLQMPKTLNSISYHGRCVIDNPNMLIVS